MFNSKYLMIVTIAAFGIGTGVFTKMSKQAKAANANEAKQQALENYGKLPLAFEPNRGQSDQAVQYLSRGDGYMLYLTKDGATMLLQNKAQRTRLQLQLVGANAQPQTEALDQLQGKANYLLGNDRAKWHTDIPTYRKVQYREVWPGVDMVWYGNQRQLEYDFIVKPNVATNQIKLRFNGAESLRLDEAGNLMLQTKGGEITQPAPVIYQDGAQGRETVAGKYVLTAANEVAFELGAYDASRRLVIDPQLVYSTYLGAEGFDSAKGIAVDAQGNAYIAGRTVSTNFPVTSGSGNSILTNAFVVKLNAVGTAQVYATVFGSADGFLQEPLDGTQANAIAVTSDGKACVTGFTENMGNGGDHPVTDNAYQNSGFCIGLTPVCNVLPDRKIDAFVSMLNTNGNGFIYSTYFGGSYPGSLSDDLKAEDIGHAIAVDASNRIYIAGHSRSNNLPTKNEFQHNPNSSGTGADAFIAVFNPALSNGNDTLLYASYLGGSGDDFGKGIAVDSVGNAYVVGGTASTDLETKGPGGQAPFRASYQGGISDAFLAKVNPNASGAASLAYLTYFGGSGTDRAESVAVDAQFRPYLTGATGSTNFPLVNAFDTTQSNGEPFVAKFNNGATALFYSSFLGGTNGTSSQGGFEEGLGIALDAAGNAYVTGRSSAGATFPTGAVAPPFASAQQGTAFVAKVQAAPSGTVGPRLLWASTFGGSSASANGIALDPRGNIYLAGSTAGNLPTTAGAFQTAFQGGSSDGWVAKIGSTFPDTIGVFRPSTAQFLLRNSNTAGNADITTTFGTGTDIPLTGDWDGDGDEEPGVFRAATGQFILNKQTFQCNPFPNCSFTTSVTFFFGQAGDLPVVGDWNGDGIDTVGVYRVINNVGNWFLTNAPNLNNTSPVQDVATFGFGIGGDIPLIGDWNGDGFDTVGVLQNGQFVITNRLQNFDPVEAVFFTFQGGAGLPFSGDWDGDGLDTMGFFNNGTMLLRNRNTTGAADLTFTFGQAGDVPVAGDWNRLP